MAGLITQNLTGHHNNSGNMSRGLIVARKRVEFQTAISVPELFDGIPVESRSVSDYCHMNS